MEASNIEEMRERQDKALAIVDKLRHVMYFDSEVHSCGAYCIDEDDATADRLLNEVASLLRGDAGKEEKNEGQD